MRIPLVLVLILAAPAWAGEYNKTISVGDAAPSWVELPGTDGKEHAIDDLKKYDVVVVAFTCSSCPVAEQYEGRLKAFAEKYAGEKSRVTLVAVNVNTVPEDRLPAMRKRAEKAKFKFAYLFDASQELGKKFGAQYTPEFFVLDRDRKVRYMGAFDDNSDASKVEKKYVEDAVAALLAKKAPEPAETLARGCRVRYNRSRDE